MNQPEALAHQDLWHRCVSTVGDAAAQLLFQAYREPHRRYHTLSHIASMLRDFDARARTWTHPRAVQWAIWFHDAVYKTSVADYPDNEPASARLMQRVLERSGERDDPTWNADLDLARRLVLATRRHQLAPGEFTPAQRDDARGFLDLDLAILAAPWEQVLAFDAAIRQEFSHHDDACFAQGRLQALRALAAGRVFQGPDMEAPEQAARDNLARLLAHWTARTPGQGVSRPA